MTQTHAVAADQIVKRSMFINARRTSMALEPIFWEAVEAAAAGARLSVPKYIAVIDRGRPASQSLASALRCAALRAINERGRKQ